MPRSISLQLVFPHFLHLKSCPSIIFSAAPFPISFCLNFSDSIFTLSFVDVVIWHLAQTM